MSKFKSSSQRGPYRTGRRKSSRQYQSAQSIDISQFINKAVITEEMPEFKPEHSFGDFAIDTRFKHLIAKRGYVSPTPIQDHAIPHLLSGSDLVGIANTGTGKTAAFLIPLINAALHNNQLKAIVMAPTRELAIQIHQEFISLTRSLPVFSACCVGGVGIGKQIMELRRSHQVVIGTPGRLIDLVKRGKIDLETFSFVVLDEADRMLDMGFINDMRFILDRIPKNRQTALFSATMSSEVEGLVSQFLRRPVKISVKTSDTSKFVEQDIVEVIGDKVDTLADLLSQREFSKVLVFGRTKYGVEKLARTLRVRGFAAESIHGDKSHNQRQAALKGFKQDKAQILVATDVAARGLDISGVSHVINYDIPATYEDYVHRIGRTGRAGAYGKALTFVEPVSAYRKRPQRHSRK